MKVALYVNNNRSWTNPPEQPLKVITVLDVNYMKHDERSAILAGLISVENSDHLLAHFTLIGAEAELHISGEDTSDENMKIYFAVTMVDIGALILGKEKKHPKEAEEWSSFFTELLELDPEKVTAKEQLKEAEEKLKKAEVDFTKKCAWGIKITLSK